MYYLKMINNLFSVFDPSSRFFYLPLNWISRFIGLLFIPSLFWLIPSRLSFSWNLVIYRIHSEFKILLNNNYKGSTLILVSIFSIILFNNFLGLFPYIFTSTSHITMTLTLSFPLWFSFMLYGWFLNTYHIFVHLVPQGTPFALISFMVLIETISNIIRPLTLAVRLTANIIAGHLLITLLGNTGPSLTIIIVLLLIIVQFLLIVLEMAVAVIQSYVFSILTTLYSGEVT